MNEKLDQIVEKSKEAERLEIFNRISNFYNELFKKFQKRFKEERDITQMRGILMGIHIALTLVDGNQVLLLEDEEL